jgi:hypothetical protein
MPQCKNETEEIAVGRKLKRNREEDMEQAFKDGRKKDVVQKHIHLTKI